MTDIPDLIPLIRKNVSLNFATWPPNVTAAALDWVELSSTPPARRSRVFPSPGSSDTDAYDLVLAVDCIYNPSLVPALLTTIDYLQTPVLVVVELRSEEVLREFIDGWLNLQPGSEGGRWEVWRLGILGMPYAAWVGWRA